jgi:hypothetical protein
VDAFAVARTRFIRNGKRPKGSVRNLLVRSVLGHAERPLQLSAPFRHDLASVLNILSLLETAWWATDYHTSWVAGALAVYLHDKGPLANGRPNPDCNGRRLVEGNQEDIDLLIAVGQHLIMVEAKACGAWSNKQVRSKLQCLDLLLAYYDQIRVTVRFMDDVILRSLDDLAEQQADGGCQRHSESTPEHHADCRPQDAGTARFGADHTEKRQTDKRSYSDDGQ